MTPSPLQSRPSHATAFSDCPEEVLSLIISYLGGTDEKRLRLVSQQLRRITTPSLCARLTVNCYHFGLQTLAELAATVHLAPLVHEVVSHISYISIDGLLRRLREVYSRSAAKCHTSLLLKLKKRSKVLGTLKPCYDLISVPKGNAYTELLSHLIMAFRSFPGQRALRVFDTSSEQHRTKPLLRDFCFKIMAIRIPILHLEDHRLRRVPSHDFQGLFSAIVLLALQLSDSHIRFLNGYFSATQDLEPSRAIAASIYPTLAQQLEAGVIRIPPTTTEVTLGLDVRSDDQLETNRQALYATITIEVSRIEVVNNAQAIRTTYPVFPEAWWTEEPKTLPRLRNLELTAIALQQNDFEGSWVRHRKSLKELRLHSTWLKGDPEVGGNTVASWPRFVAFLRRCLSLERICLDGELRYDMHLWFAYFGTQLTGHATNRPRSLSPYTATVYFKRASVSLPRVRPVKRGEGV